MKVLNAATRRWALGLALPLLAALASCGGGTQIDPFAPGRLIAFGDENSAFDPSPAAGKEHKRRKYTVNSYDAAGDIDCLAYLNWVQYLAGAQSLAMDECNSAGAASTSKSYAKAGAGVDDLPGQVSAFGASGAFAENDLVTVYVGANDITREFQKGVAPGGDWNLAVANVEALGDRLAAQVNAIANTGAKVLVLMIPDVGMTPYAAALGADAVQQLSTLSARFNTRLGFNIIQDGHMIALLKANDLLRTLRAGVGVNGLTDITSTACDATKYPTGETSLLNCSDSTLVTGASTSTWLWADSLHFGPAGHSFLGQAAVTQVKRNPL